MSAHTTRGQKASIVAVAVDDDMVADLDHLHAHASLLLAVLASDDIDVALEEDGLRAVAEEIFGTANRLRSIVHHQARFRRPPRALARRGRRTRTAGAAGRR